MPFSPVQDSDPTALRTALMTLPDLLDASRTTQSLRDDRGMVCGPAGSALGTRAPDGRVEIDLRLRTGQFSGHARLRREEVCGQLRDAMTCTLEALAVLFPGRDIHFELIPHSRKLSLTLDGMPLLEATATSWARHLPLLAAFFPAEDPRDAETVWVIDPRGEDTQDMHGFNPRDLVRAAMPGDALARFCLLDTTQGNRLKGRFNCPTVLRAAGRLVAPDAIDTPDNAPDTTHVASLLEDLVGRVREISWPGPGEVHLCAAMEDGRWHVHAPELRTSLLLHPHVRGFLEQASLALVRTLEESGAALATAVGDARFTLNLMRGTHSTLLSVSVGDVTHTEPADIAPALVSAHVHRKSRPYAVMASHVGLFLVAAPTPDEALARMTSSHIAANATVHLVDPATPEDLDAALDGLADALAARRAAAMTAGRGLDRLLAERLAALNA